MRAFCDCLPYTVMSLISFIRHFKNYRQFYPGLQMCENGSDDSIFLGYVLYKCGDIL